MHRLLYVFAVVFAVLFVCDVCGKLAMLFSCVIMCRSVRCVAIPNRQVLQTFREDSAEKTDVNEKEEAACRE